MFKLGDRVMVASGIRTGLKGFIIDVNPLGKTYVEHYRVQYDSGPFASWIHYAINLKLLEEVVPLTVTITESYV